MLIYMTHGYYVNVMTMANYITNIIHGTGLIFEWVLKLRIWVLIVIIGTYVHGILVIDGYLCSRVYGMKVC